MTESDDSIIERNTHMQKIYLDNNATTPLDPSVKIAMMKSLDLWTNPSNASENENSIKAAKAIEDARSSVANLFDTSDERVFFTSSGTEANNWIIHGAIQQYLDSKKPGKPHVVTSVIEHPSIIEPLKIRQANGEIDVTYVPVDPETGAVCVEAIVEAVTDSTCLVTIMLANNETGVIQPVAPAFEQIREKFPNPPVLHTDVAQVAGKQSIEFCQVDADAFTVSAHKFYGPRIGALIFRRSKFKIQPMNFGGNEEMGKRSGSENTPLIVGFGKAARMSSDYCQIMMRHYDNRCYFEENITEKLGDGALIHFEYQHRVSNTTSIAFLNYPSTAADLLKNCKTFVASTGASYHKSDCSPTLIACGIPPEIASKTIRISFGRNTTREEIDTVIEELVHLC